MRHRNRRGGQGFPAQEWSDRYRPLEASARAIGTREGAGACILASMGKRDDGDDAELFRSAIGPVRELPAAPPAPARPKPRPRARMAERDEADAREEFSRLMRSDRLEAGDVLRYRRDHVPPHVLRRLQRGAYAVQDELDLHGADSNQASRLLREFLSDAVHAGAGCIRIVHGKGLGADGRTPVLKNLVDRQLRQRADVLAFHSAPHNQGGTGAVLVLLAS